jgi:hypothetical protein
MSRLKVKCATCGRVFVPSNARQTLCADCEKTRRAARVQTRVATSDPTQARQAPPPLIMGPGASVLRLEDAPPGASIAPVVDESASTPNGASETPDAAPQQADTPARRGRRPRSSGSGAQPQRAPKKPRIPTAPFALTDALRQRIEERYLALADPVEFDGIRTQIARELGAPKAAVRTVVGELRARRGMPSWWELQGFAGSPDDLERIKAAYTPLLPLPAVGVHKEIAQSLGMEPRTVYRGIRKIRALMGLAQYNAPIDAS